MDSLSIRETFLTFYEERGHRRFPSASLIPSDPSVLLTIAGMLPFKPWFMGDEPAPVRRAVSHQKCVRTNDIENVGRTTRHLSFFEMLGNFSFGDYFKRDAMRWAWELSIDGFGLDPERIWVTIYEEDDEAEELWLTETDLPASRLQRLGADDNYWWTHAAGPGGPNSELYYDRGEAYGEAGGPAVNDERYLEFYNLVFMQHALDAGATSSVICRRRTSTRASGSSAWRCCCRASTTCSRPTCSSRCSPAPVSSRDAPTARTPRRTCRCASSLSTRAPLRSSSATACSPPRRGAATCCVA
jgi:alanyl-tRNA synthetase